MNIFYAKDVQIPPGLPEKYNKDLIILLGVIDGTNNIKIKRKWFSTFVTKYTTIPDVWNLWLNQEIAEFNIYVDAHGQTPTEEIINFCEKMMKTALCHFYDSVFLQNEVYVRLDGSINCRQKKENRKFTKLMSFPYFKNDWGEYLSGEKIPSIQKVEEALSYPHRYLTEVLDTYKENLHSRISKELKTKYEKNNNLYKEISETLKGSFNEKWMNVLLKSGEEFAVQNIEYYLAKIPCDKNIWKLYIQFWKDKNNIKMLSIYSRSCHLFIYDIQMREKYFQEVAQLHERKENVVNYWADIVNIEALMVSPRATLALADRITMNNLNIFSDYNQRDEEEMGKICKAFLENMLEIRNVDKIEYSYIWFMKDLYALRTPLISMEENGINSINSQSHESQMDKVKSNFKKGKFDCFKYQNFALPNTLLQYLCKHPNIHQKLNMTCKYFYSQEKCAYCYSFTIFDDDKSTFNFAEYSLMMSSKFFNKHFKSGSKFLDKLFITNLLHIDNPIDKHCFSTVMNMFFKLNIKYLKLYNQNLTLNDIKVLNEKCNLKSIRLFNINICNTNYKVVTVEEAINCFPSVKRIYLRCPDLIFTYETAKNLAEMKRKVSFSEFGLEEVPNNLDAKDFCCFLCTHMALTSKFTVKFKDKSSEASRIFYHHVSSYIENWKPYEDAPLYI